MPVRLFVGNLSYDTTEAELREHFSSVGPLSYVYLPTDRESGKPRGFAFLEFNDRAQAEEAIHRFNNQPFKGRPLAINEARDKEDRPRTGMTSRPPQPWPAFAEPPDMGGLPSREGRPSRDFGPDAAPRRSRNKAKSGPKSERAPKGPMREVVRGRFFGGGEDDDYDDDSFDEESSGENFASRVIDPDSEDNT